MSPQMCSKCPTKGISLAQEEHIWKGERARHIDFSFGRRCAFLIKYQVPAEKRKMWRFVFFGFLKQAASFLRLTLMVVKKIHITLYTQLIESIILSWFYKSTLTCSSIKTFVLISTKLYRVYTLTCAFS